MKSDDLFFLNQQLAGMLRHGIPIEGALKQLCAGLARGKLRHELELLGADLAQGKTVEEALSARRLPRLYVTLLKLGWRGQNLPAVLNLVADYYHRTGLISTRLKGLMVYPAIVLVCSLCLSVWFATLHSALAGSGTPSLGSPPATGATVAGTFRQTAVINTAPSAAARPAQPNASSPLISPRSGQGSAVQAGIWMNLWMPPLFLLSAVIFIIAATSVPAVRRHLRWRVPPFRDASVGQLCDLLQLLLHSGASWKESLELVRIMENDSPAARELERWQERLSQGHSRFADIAKGSTLLPPLCVWLVSTAGEDLASGFARAKDIYYSRARYRTELLLNVALPASLLVLGFMILTQVYPFATSIFRLMGPDGMLRIFY